MTVWQLLIFLILWAADVYLGGLLGKHKGNTGGGIFLALVLGPLGLVIIALIPRSAEAKAAAERARHEATIAAWMQAGPSATRWMPPGAMPAAAPKTPPRRAPKRRNGLVIAGVVTCVAFVSTALIAVLSSRGGPMCTTNGCIVTDLQNNLTGLVADDDQVITKVSCDPASVVQAAGTWTATCTATYTGGSIATGQGNLDTTVNKVTFVPSGSP